MNHRRPVLLFLLAITIVLANTGCKKSNSPTNVLPPETHVGLNTMGCIVNGQLFIPQETGYPPHQFSTAAISSRGVNGITSIIFNWTDQPNCGLSFLNIYLDSVQLQAGDTLTLGLMPDSSFTSSRKAQWATYMSFPCDSGSVNQYSTNSQVSGQMIIDYYEYATDIILVAGRFSFDAIDKYGDTVHIREGRFDMAFQN
jgi:hypothetical protein